MSRLIVFECYVHHSYYELTQCKISTKFAAHLLRYKLLNICTVQSNFLVWESVYKSTILY